jgi:hypothetical protein
MIWIDSISNVFLRSSFRLSIINENAVSEMITSMCVCVCVRHVSSAFSLATKRKDSFIHCNRSGNDASYEWTSFEWIHRSESRLASKISVYKWVVQTIYQICVDRSYSTHREKHTSHETTAVCDERLGILELMICFLPEKIFISIWMKSITICSHAFASLFSMKYVIHHRNWCFDIQCSLWQVLRKALSWLNFYITCTNNQ